MTAHPPTDLAQQFRYYAETVFSNSSPLYAHLSAAAADDTLLMHALRPYTGRRVFPVLFMGAMHATLMAHPTHPLHRYFHSHTPTPLKPFGAYPALRDLFFAEREQVEHLLQTRIVQTNEVRRCTSILPTLGRIAAHTGQALALIEIGPSLGLMLNWHRYHYDYGAGRTLAPRATRPSTTDSTPALTLDTTCRSNRLPLPRTMPPLHRAVGIDINPLQVSNADDVRWLQALIWPEHHERRARLDQALAIAHAHPPTIYQGDARERLYELLPDILQPGVTPVVLHSYALVQLPKAERDALFAPLRALATRQQPIFRVQLEWYRTMQYPEVWRYVYRGGRPHGTKEAEVEAHGTWIRWWARR